MSAPGVATPAAVGLEIGGTWLRAVALDDDGTVGAGERLATPGEPNALGSMLVEVFDRLGVARDGEPMPAIGLAAAPALDAARHVARWPSRPELVGASVGPALRDGGLEPDLIVDDGSAAAVTEHFEASRDQVEPSTTLFVGVGTGVGGGLVVRDEPWLGARGGALDVGHMPIRQLDEACGCGRRGCLQTVASGPVLAAASTPSAFEAAAAALGQALSALDRLIEPHRFVLGGGVLDGPDLFDRIVEHAVEEGVETPILRGRWGTWSGAVGAAVLALRARGVRLRRLVDGLGEGLVAGLTAAKHGWRIAVVQGPNLNLLGEREVEWYGRDSLDDLERRLDCVADSLDVKLVHVQSNHEGVLVDWLQARRHRLDGVVVNPAALTARGYGLRDALTGTALPFVEVHLSRIDAREDWHRESCFAAVAAGRVSGLGVAGYELALRGLLHHLHDRQASEAAP